MQDSNLNIVLIDDDEDDYFLISKALSRIQQLHQLIWFNSAEKAIKHLEQAYDQSLVPDIVLLDLNMPRVNGFDFLKYISSSKLKKALFISVLSSSNSQEDMSQALKLGAKAYISKQADLEHLKNRLKDLINSIV